MSILQRFLNVFSSNINSVSVTDSNYYINSKGLNLGKFDSRKAELNSTVYTCINIISNTIAKFPIHVMRIENGKKVKAQDHSWYNALRYTPFRSTNSQKVISNGLTNMYLTGNKFYYVQQFDDSLNINKQLIPLSDPIAIADYQNETFYKFENSNSWLPAKDLIHFYNLSKDNKLGLNPINSIMTELNIQKYGEQALQATYENGLFGTLYLESNLEGVVGKPDLVKQREWYDQLKTDFTSYRNSGKIPKIDPYFRLKSIPPNQIDFLNNNKYSISQVGALFGVPEVLLGVQNSQTYGKAGEQIGFFNSTLSNITSMILAELNQKLLTAEEKQLGYYIDMDYSSLYELDLVAKAQYIVSLAQHGVYSPNEIRQIFNTDTVDNEFMNMHFLQSQNLAIEQYDQWGNNKVVSNPATKTTE